MTTKSLKWTAALLALGLGVGVIFKFEDWNGDRGGFFDSACRTVFGPDGVVALALGQHVLRRHDLLQSGLAPGASMEDSTDASTIAPTEGQRRAQSSPLPETAPGPATP